MAATSQARARRSFVVVGGGIAGLATARFLSLRDDVQVVLVDGADGDDTGRKTGPRHSTGRSAEIFRAAAGDPIVRGLARETRRLYADPQAAGLSSSLDALHRVGLFVATANKDTPWQQDLETTECERCDAAEELAHRASHFVPSGEHIAWFPDAGRVRVLELVAALEHATTTSGTEILRGSRIASIETEDRRVQSVRLENGATLESTDVVIAAGAWSGALGASVDAPVPLRPTLRHMVVFERSGDTAITPPIVWDDSARFYVRAEGNEWWASCCDTVDVENPPTADYPVDRETVERVTSLFRKHVPGETAPRLVRTWSGYRDLTPDDRPVLGPDHRVDGLHWCAGLGGHGMTIGLAAGREVAELALGGRSFLGERCLAERFESEIVGAPCEVARRNVVPSPNRHGRP